ncbi:MAG: diguanylate cyclase [Rubrivivax sp.]
MSLLSERNLFSAEAPDVAPTASLSAPLQVALVAVLDAMLQRSGELLSVKDAASGRYVHVNRAMAEALQIQPGRMAGSTDAELLDAALAGTLRAADQAALAHGRPLASEHRLDFGAKAHTYAALRTVVEVEGRSLLCAVWTDLAPERQRDHQLQHALGQLEQQQRANELLRQDLSDQAMRDPASGLYRRARFDDQLRRELDLSTREHREFAIVFIELDAPGAAEVRTGEAGSQRVFEAVGRLLRSGTRAMDASCRFGERRFAVLLSGVGLATAHARMEGLRRKCATQIVVQEGIELGFTVSVGVASFPHTAQAQEPLVGACEAALAEAQRRGGNHVALAAIPFETGLR